MMSSKQQEAGVAKKEVAEESSSKDGEKNEEKATEETGNKGQSRGAPLVVPHFPQSSTPGLL
ncbi:hypothetical protein ACP70R_019941 [Stipagrostis hirtigluma subsp. patula]